MFRIPTGASIRVRIQIPVLQFTSQHFLLLFKFNLFIFTVFFILYIHTVYYNICAMYWSKIFSQSVYVYLTWGPVTWGCHRPPLCICTMYKVRLYVQCTNNSDIEKTSGQAAQFHIWTIWSMDRTSAQPQVNLSLLRSDSLKFQLLYIWQ